MTGLSGFGVRGFEKIVQIKATQDLICVENDQSLARVINWVGHGVTSRLRGRQFSFESCLAIFGVSLGPFHFLHLSNFKLLPSALI